MHPRTLTHITCTEVTELSTTAEPNVVKLRKAAQETDVAQRTYGEQMAQKVLVLCDKYDSLKPTLSSLTEKINDGVYVHVYACMCMCVCMHLHACVYVCMYVSACMYVHMIR